MLIQRKKNSLRPCLVTQKKTSYNAYFHCWAPQSMELRDGTVSNYVVGIIERTNGEILEVEPDEIQFLDRGEE